MTYQNLDLRYGGSHGIAGVDSDHMTVSECDISFCGGSLECYDGNTNPVRYGNGIDYYGDVHDNLVKDAQLRISMMPDSLTNPCRPLPLSIISPM